uniref:Uncharacterized protein n=1 Tax=Ixodes ricinus TaxID=34613 RepID=A0A0K8RC54_IXORI
MSVAQAGVEDWLQGHGSPKTSCGRSKSSLLQRLSGLHSDHSPLDSWRTCGQDGAHQDRSQIPAYATSPCSSFPLYSIYTVNLPSVYEQIPRVYFPAGTTRITADHCVLYQNAVIAVSQAALRRITHGHLEEATRL